MDAKFVKVLNEESSKSQYQPIRSKGVVPIPEHPALSANLTYHSPIYSTPKERAHVKNMYSGMHR